MPRGDRTPGDPGGTPERWRAEICIDDHSLRSGRDGRHGSGAVNFFLISSSREASENRGEDQTQCFLTKHTLLFRLQACCTLLCLPLNLSLNFCSASLNDPFIFF